MQGAMLHSVRSGKFNFVAFSYHVGSEVWGVPSSECFKITVDVFGFVSFVYKLAIQSGGSLDEVMGLCACDIETV